MDSQDVQIIQHETPYRGYFRIDRYRLRHKLFNGGISPELSREVFERGHAVGVILYDPDRDAVVLIEQFRVGALAAHRRPWITEIVAGIIDPGEEPADVARRETYEEAGCDVIELLPIYDYLVSPGCSSETVKLFCGRVDSRKIGGVYGLAHEGEDIRVSVVPLEDALRDLASGRIESSIAIIGLQWLALNRDMLRKRWSSEAGKP
ncbi:MAG TPA: NUDIX domain-containing protein [Alphaproteobacteria bacterium]